MIESKPLNMPMSSNYKLDWNKEGEKFDQKLYRCMIRSLLYLTTSRPDIYFSIGACAR